MRSADGERSATAAVFDAPACWRADSIERAGLTGARRVAAASPGPAFPQLLWFLNRHLGEVPPGPVVDAGAGLGGVAEAVRAATRRDVVGCEPTWGSCSSARRLFPELAMAQATGEALPVRTGAAAAVVLCGVVSLVPTLEPLLDEVVRVLHPAGRLLVVDLVSADAHDHDVGPNRFRSLETLHELLAAAGLGVVDVATALVDVGEWSEVGRVVTDDVVARHRGDPGYDEWRADLDHLGAVMADGTVITGGLAASR